MKRIYFYYLCLFFQNANWLVPKHSGTNYPIYITWSQRDGDNVRKITKCLTVDCHKIWSAQLHQIIDWSSYSLVKLHKYILELTSKVSIFSTGFTTSTEEPLKKHYFHTLNVNWHVSQMTSCTWQLPFFFSDLQIQSRLKIDHCIVESFVPLLHCATEEFRNVSNSKGIVHKLKDLKWDSRKVIRHFQEARESLLLVRNYQ